MCFHVSININKINKITPQAKCMAVYSNFFLMILVYLHQYSLLVTSLQFAQRMDDATKFFRYNMKIRSVPEEGAPLSGEASG